MRRAKVTAVAGFPPGQMTTEAKPFEVRDAIAKGAARPGTGAGRAIVEGFVR